MSDRDLKALEEEVRLSCERAAARAAETSRRFDEEEERRVAAKMAEWRAERTARDLADAKRFGWLVGLALVCFAAGYAACLMLAAEASR